MRKRLWHRRIVGRPGFAEFGHVGMVGRNRSLGRIVKVFGLKQVHEVPPKSGTAVMLN